MIILECNKLFVDLIFSDDVSGQLAELQYLETEILLPPGKFDINVSLKYDKAESKYWSDQELKLHRISIPVIVSNGSEDLITPVNNAFYIAKQIGSNAIVEIKYGKRHTWFLEDIDSFIQLCKSLHEK